VAIICANVFLNLVRISIHEDMNKLRLFHHCFKHQRFLCRVVRHHVTYYDKTERPQY